MAMLRLTLLFIVLWYENPLTSVRLNYADAFGLIGLGSTTLQNRGDKSVHGRHVAPLCQTRTSSRMTHSTDGNFPGDDARGTISESTAQRVSFKNITLDFNNPLSLDKSKSPFAGKLAFLEGSRLYEDTDFYTLSVWKTPLWMITQEPDLNNLVQYLQDLRVEILSAPNDRHLIRFSRAKIEKARSAFSRMVRRGEMRLHRLCELTADEILGGNYTRQSVVVGQRPTRDQQRFQLVQPLSAEELYASTDLDLGSRQLERFMWQTSSRWQRAALVANFVEYQARIAPLRSLVFPALRIVVAGRGLGR
jgi:hypothetical protein